MYFFTLQYVKYYVYKNKDEKKKNFNQVVSLDRYYPKCLREWNLWIKKKYVVGLRGRYDGNSSQEWSEYIYM